jgi:hypothetical protein
VEVPMRAALLLFLLGCDDTEGEEDPLEEMCDHLTDSFEACATESTTSTGTASAECEDTFAECSQADLDLLVGIGDCVAADCEDFTCYDAFADLSPECLGITAGT